MCCPAAHATMKAFGSSRAPLAPGDEDRIVEAVAAWAATPTDRAASRVHPAVRRGGSGAGGDPRDDRALTEAIGDLWERCAAANLPAGSSDASAPPTGARICRCATSDAAPPEATWELLRAWARYVEVGETASIAYEAEVVAFGDGVERRLGRFPFRP